jgi:hypothetical protein
METICIWPDGDWCYWDELEDFFWKSDDFFITQAIDEDDAERQALEHTGATL